jgi:hypothetical protein
VTTDPAVEPVGQPMIGAFPEGGALIRLAYRELNITANGTKEQIKAIGDPRLLPRPWDPATCRNTELREQVWAWLEDVVTWLNREYVWDVAGVIPSCWPQHPHLAHEIAVLADQRRAAGTALTSDALEEWHRYALPAFLDRMRTRVKDHCEEGHQGWPARSRYAPAHQRHRPPRTHRHLQPRRADHHPTPGRRVARAAASGSREPGHGRGHLGSLVSEV